MATYTPNLNLGKPEATDAFSGFRQLFNDNMDILDNGGGGGSGGHTIIDQSGNAMPSRTGLQFIGASVTDDSVNNKTVVTVTGGGGGVHYSTSEQVIGTWIDGKPLYEKTIHVANSQGSFSDYVTIETMTDLKMSVSADFTARRYIAGTGEWFISGNGTARAEQNDTYYIGVRVFNQNLQYVIGGYGTQITDLWITVRYTKTTD